MSTLSVTDAQEAEAGSFELPASYSTPEGSGINEEFLRHLDGGIGSPLPAAREAPSPHPPAKSEIPPDRAEEPPRALTRPASGVWATKNETYTPSNEAFRQQQVLQQQLRSPQQRHQELVAARREQQQQVTEAHNEWRWAERMKRVAMHQQQRHLESDWRQTLQMHPSRGLPASFQGQHRQKIGLTFCPHRLASIYNLSIRYWDEGCASLAVRTLQGALQMLQQYELVGGCVTHTWEAMQLLRGSKQQRALGPTGTAAPPTGLSTRKLDIKERYLRSRVFFSRRMFVAAEKELEEVRGHLGSLLCRASLRGGGLAVAGNADRRCSRIKEALARVEDDLLLLQELQARYSSAQSSEWGDDLQQRQLQRLVPLNLMPCMSQRIHLQNFKGPSGNTQEEEECEQWARTLHQVLLRQITARGNPTQD